MSALGRRRRQGGAAEGGVPSPSPIGAQIRSSVQALKQLCELDEIRLIPPGTEASSTLEG